MSHTFFAKEQKRKQTNEKRKRANEQKMVRVNGHGELKKQHQRLVPTKKTKKLGKWIVA
jgi:hypothetical protein